MCFKRHIIGGAIVSGVSIALLLYIGLLGSNKIFLAAILGIAFSLIPDIDMPQTLPNRILAIGSFVLLLIGMYIKHNTLLLIGVIGIGIALLFPMIFKHRGVTHKVIFGVLLAAGIYYFLGKGVCIVALCGFLTHLILDLKIFLREKKKKKAR
ncbi:MAG: metal-dependent hydrolase [Candidatus Pacearchaeota archaeon]